MPVHGQAVTQVCRESVATTTAASTSAAATAAAAAVAVAVASTAVGIFIKPRVMKAKNVTIPMKIQTRMMTSVLVLPGGSDDVRSFVATIRVMTCSANVGGITTQ